MEIMKYRIALVLVLLAALTRLLPHPHNFTPIAAIGLFGAAVFERRMLMFFVPFAALFLSDLFINNVIYAAYQTGFAWYTSLWIYAAFAAVIVVGRLLLQNQISTKKVVGASLSASVIFFLVTNFSVWVESGMYPKTLSGLTACFAAGVPFFGNTILGDLFFSAVLFGGYAWAMQNKLVNAALRAR
ncbi:MAG: hypothetical protein IPM98_03605 [Lewinellaceae bacterium]|nr:hypothetical protein [Lewinellaceae bacterium]